MGVFLLNTLGNTVFLLGLGLGSTIITLLVMVYIGSPTSGYQKCSVL